MSSTRKEPKKPADCIHLPSTHFPSGEMCPASLCNGVRSLGASTPTLQRAEGRRSLAHPGDLQGNFRSAECDCPSRSCSRTP